MTSERTTVAGAGETHGSMTMTREGMVAFFKRRQEAYEDLDAAGLAADYADDAVIESPTAGVHTGRDAAEKAFRAVFTAFLDMTMTVDDLIIDGDRAATVLSIEGTHIGELLGLQPTGKRFTMSAVFFYEVKNGRIVRERRIYDFTGLLLQIGVLKAKPA
ncbi:MAG TPA: ester cyclase [Opitutaceae bacterium]